MTRKVRAWWMLREWACKSVCPSSRPIQFSRYHYAVVPFIGALARCTGNPLAKSSNAARSGRTERMIHDPRMWRVSMLLSRIQKLQRLTERCRGIGRMKMITLEVKVLTGGTFRPSLYRDTGLGPFCLYMVGNRS